MNDALHFFNWIFGRNNKYNNITSYNSIVQDLEDVINKYQIYKFDSPNSDQCNTIEVLYKDKLMNINSDELSEVLTVGFKTVVPKNKDANIYKKELCESILQQLKKRYMLLVHIYDSINKAISKLTKAINGEYCASNSNNTHDIDDLIKCKKLFGTWVSTDDQKNRRKNMKKNLHDYKYQNWKDKVLLLNNEINKYLRILQNNIIKKIKCDIVNPNGDEWFNNIEKEANGIIAEMNVTTNKLFDIIIAI